MILISSHNIHFYGEIRKITPKLSSDTHLTLFVLLKMCSYFGQVEQKRKKDLIEGDEKIKKAAEICEGHVERKV